MAIFYWNNHGRLGNLLFQYAGILRYISAEDCVYSFHNEVFDLLDADDRFRVLPGSGKFAHRIKLRINELALAAVRMGMVGIVEPQHQMMLQSYRVELPTLTKTVGAVSRWFVIQGYHQDGRLREMPIVLKPEIVVRAKNRIGLVAHSTATVGVHIRLTDYASWSVLGVHGAMIDPCWYRDRMSDLRQRLGPVTFVIFSDDIGAARGLLWGSDVVYFEGESALEDFAAMSVCDHAIISPSSFAWWSACVNKGAKKIIMAPEYWAGFKSTIWYPPTIITQGFEYYPVRAHLEDEVRSL